MVSRADLRLVLSGTFSPDPKRPRTHATRPTDKPIGEFEAGYWTQYSETLVAASRMRVAVRARLHFCVRCVRLIERGLCSVQPPFQELRQSDLRAFFVLCPEALSAMVQSFPTYKTPFRVLTLSPLFAGALQRFLEDTDEDQLKVDYQVRVGVATEQKPF